MSGLDWSSTGVDWRDATHDSAMASDWLRNQRLGREHVRLHPRPRGWYALDLEEKMRLSAGLPDGYDLDLDARVLELLQQDLDAERGWRLVLTLLQLPQSSEDRISVMDAVLTFVRNHRDAFYDRILERLGSEPFYQPLVARIQQGWPESVRQEPAP
jgi:hypothetical protein